MGGSRSFSPDNSNAARAMPKRICEGAMPMTIATEDANASQRAACSMRAAGAGDDSVTSMLDLIIPKRRARGCAAFQPDAKSGGSELFLSSEIYNGIRRRFAAGR